jgi:putative oxidoreductase
MMLDKLLATDHSKTLLLQRVVLGAVLLPHGLQKTIGAFGGHGFDGTMTYFTNGLHIPAPLAVLVILAESLGAVALIAGIGTRIAAGGAVAVMIGAALLTHLPYGFFMNWFGAQGGEGFEYHILAVALGLPLVIRGGGAFSVDRILARVLRRPSPTLVAAGGNS